MKIVGGVADAGGEFPGARGRRNCRLDWLDRKLGRTVSAVEVRRILESLEFGVQECGPRTFFGDRSLVARQTKDVRIKDDLVEEVGRMVGYDTITPRAPLVPTLPPPENPSRVFQHEVRALFIDQGYTEVSNYSFLSEETAVRFGFDPAGLLKVGNPIASDQALMRTSLVPGIWRDILENAKHRDAFSASSKSARRFTRAKGSCRRRFRTWPRRSTHARAMARRACSNLNARP